MKSAINSFLHRNEKNIKDLCTYLYNNPETSYNEHNSCEYICNLLNSNNFSVQKNFLDINNSFYAQKGTGYPKICFLCEYDAIENEGHITGHNVITTIATVCSLALGNITDKCSASIILIGCPGEYLGGSKGIMVKQGIFNDIDVVMEVHPDIETCESGSSSAIEPIGISFECDNKLSFLDKKIYTPLDCTLLMLNMLNSIQKTFPDGLHISYVISNGGFTPLLVPSKCEIKFYIRAKNSDLILYGDSQLRKIAKFVSQITSINSKFFLYEQPNKELITNHTLNRLFSHNLKENGIIHINPPKDVYAGLSIGDVSHIVPTIHPYISITDNPNIKYGSKEFAQCTISEYCFSQIMIAVKALAHTSADIIKNESLLNEAKNEFFNHFS